MYEKLTPKVGGDRCVIEFNSNRFLIISVGSNNEGKELLHRFQVDLLLNAK